MRKEIEERKKMALDSERWLFSIYFYFILYYE